MWQAEHVQRPFRPLFNKGQGPGGDLAVYDTGPA